MFFFTEHTMRHVDDATSHYHQYGNFMSVIPGPERKFSFSKRACFLGTSFVSLSVSQSGWGYETSNEMDGFLITTPHIGDFEWRTSNGRYRLEKGGIALIDQLDVKRAAHSEGTKYTTVYISNIDMFRYLTMLLGKPPKTRIYFTKNFIGVDQAKFIHSLIETIFLLSSNQLAPSSEVGTSLKESLVGFIILNVPNNYSKVLHDASYSMTPTPHSIKIAVQFMQDSIDPHLTVGQVAVHAGVSVRSLQAGFKRFKKTTPITYLREIRLQKAKNLLMESSAKSPKEVAGICGFTNYQLFCKYYSATFFEHPSTTAVKCRKIIVPQ
ncbi:helix-turn-helix domain-containing protein [Pseudomonas sp. Z13]|uniref:helix-turn-helix domain-containing protein n=1 Tax=Pseudomonas sp. Z13 TaxID=2983409 RepID=UPI002E809DE2|nr:helix-turn-helix domain-containing protein [Pseudomonas sp. Z13]